MLKIVVFDSGFGGELFADRLETELPTAEVIRVINWRSAEEMQKNPFSARKAAERALRPYIGKVDLIVIANYLVSTTSLKYFRRKYKNQRFVGFVLRIKRIVVHKPTLILTTKATSRSIEYMAFAHRIRAKTICLDSWPLLIDDGELTQENIQSDLTAALGRINNFSPEQVLLACGQFTELKPKFREVFGHNVRILDSFNDTLRDTFRVLGISTAHLRIK